MGDRKQRRPDFGRPLVESALLRASSGSFRHFRCMAVENIAAVCFKCLLPLTIMPPVNGGPRPIQAYTAGPRACHPDFLGRTPGVHLARGSMRERSRF